MGSDQHSAKVARGDFAAGFDAEAAAGFDAEASTAFAQLVHELKTPLAIVLALCAHMLDGERLGAADSGDVRGIRSAAYTLLDRLEELLHVTRLGTGRLTLETRRVDVAALVRESIAAFHIVAEGRDQRLVMLGPPHLHADVDDLKLLTILSNLIVNALKFTPPGGVIRCTLGATADRIRLEVADSGPGVPLAAREAVFERYRRAPDAGAGGTGLGLAIVRELVELHGGTVTIGDAPEGGALLTVEVAAAFGVRAGHDLPTVGVAEGQRPAPERLQG